MSFFDVIDDIINKSADRWENIEERTAIIKSDLENNKKIDVKELAKLIVNLVEHFRPMNASKEDLQNIGKDIKEMLKK